MPLLSSLAHFHPQFSNPLPSSTHLRMSPPQYKNLQSRVYVEKLLAFYNTQSSLSHVELPMLPTPPESDTASTTRDNDRDNDGNAGLILDYNIAVNSAISLAVLRRNEEVVLALRQINSRWVREWRIRNPGLT
jgi:hypothetical protein